MGLQQGETELSNVGVMKGPGPMEGGRPVNRPDVGVKRKRKKRNQKNCAGRSSSARRWSREGDEAERGKEGDWGVHGVLGIVRGRVGS